MEKSSRHHPILPYDLGVEIWTLIDQGSSTPEIIKRLYLKAPAGVSQGQFEFCVRTIRGKHTLGQRPSKKGRKG
jgi:hypothetical protein